MHDNDVLNQEHLAFVEASNPVLKMALFL